MHSCGRGTLCVGVPLSGRDCRVALRAPRNDMRGVSPRNNSNDKTHSTLLAMTGFRAMSFIRTSYLLLIT
ncbi:MAG: hypothetical protein LBL66_11215 [Clostridiales bacterium]|nr:hypothetical protein [Clostridiales bacterium]